MYGGTRARIIAIVLFLSILSLGLLPIISGEESGIKIKLLRERLSGSTVDFEICSKMAIIGGEGINYDETKGYLYLKLESEKRISFQMTGDEEWRKKWGTTNIFPRDVENPTLTLRREGNRIIVSSRNCWIKRGEEYYKNASIAVGGEITVILRPLDVWEHIFRRYLARTLERLEIPHEKVRELTSFKTVYGYNTNQPDTICFPITGDLFYSENGLENLETPKIFFREAGKRLLYEYLYGWRMKDGNNFVTNFSEIFSQIWRTNTTYEENVKFFEVFPSYRELEPIEMLKDILETCREVKELLGHPPESFEEWAEIKILNLLSMNGGISPAESLPDLIGVEFLLVSDAPYVIFLPEMKNMNIHLLSDTIIDSEGDTYIIKGLESFSICLTERDESRPIVLSYYGGKVVFRFGKYLNKSGNIEMNCRDMILRMSEGYVAFIKNLGYRPIILTLNSSLVELSQGDFLIIRKTDKLIIDILEGSAYVSADGEWEKVRSSFRIVVDESGKSKIGEANMNEIEDFGWLGIESLSSIARYGFSNSSENMEDRIFFRKGEEVYFWMEVRNLFKNTEIDCCLRSEDGKSTVFDLRLNRTISNGICILSLGVLDRGKWKLEVYLNGDKVLEEDFTVYDLNDCLREFKIGVIDGSGEFIEKEEFTSDEKIYIYLNIGGYLRKHNVTVVITNQWGYETKYQFGILRRVVLDQYISITPTYSGLWRVMVYIDGKRISVKEFKVESENLIELLYILLLVMLYVVSLLTIRRRVSD